MPTAFTTKAIGDTIASAHVNALQDAVNNLENGSAVYFAAGGSANAYTGTLSPAVSTLTAGFAVAMLANHDNTGAATLDLNSTGAVAIKKTDGATDLESGDVRDGQVYLLVHDGTYWQVVGGGGGGGTQTVNPATCDARLTLTSGVPVTTADVTAASTVYLTPYRGCLVSLYDGTAWTYSPLTEKSLSLSGLTAGKNYDVFLHDASGTLTLTLSSAWTNDTTRADALAYQDGVRVLASDHTKRLVGTIRATGADTTESSLLRRFVVNEFHPLPISCGVMKLGEWSYASNTWRYANNDSACKVEFLCGSVGHVEGIGFHTMRAIDGEASISIDNSPGITAGVFGCYTGLTDKNSTRNSQINAELSEGYHFLGCVELAWSGTLYCTAAGLKATIWA
jgi:hypothetical protein